MRHLIVYPPICISVRPMKSPRKPDGIRIYKLEKGEKQMYRNHWKRLLCLALVLTLLMSISAVLAAPYDAKNTENTYDQTGNQFTPSIDTDLSYDSYACLGDSIAAGFGDYDY